MHFQAYAKNKDVEIHAVCDLNEQRAHETMKKHNAEAYYTNYHDLLNDP
ncbi:putative dehydrogenase [Bacillus pakistanensis]|uniref:Dehydrogenase n=1 Tax=Rossellomorea pakistanensis TaxID=992288 RepID=A0ABS2N9J3_9BACI|nr:putative dehydrogenase [Bacillus pakistanensis]